MSTVVTCPKCGNGLKTETINYRLRSYCNHCGGLPYRDGKPETGRGHIGCRPVVATEAAE